MDQPEEPARWKRAVYSVSGGDCLSNFDRLDCFGNLGFGVGQLYAAKYFPPASKAKVESLVTKVKAAFRSRLERAKESRVTHAESVTYEFIRAEQQRAAAEPIVVDKLAAFRDQTPSGMPPSWPDS